MATDIATLGIKIEAGDIRKAVSELDRLENQSKKTESKVNKLRRSFGGLQTAIGALGLALLARQMIGQINTYTALNNKLKLVTKGTDGLAKAHADLFDIAQDTRGSLEGTIDLYSRLARSTQELDISSERLNNVTKTVNQTIALSGASASTAQAALFQLGQGLGAGALRGEELNSVLEGTPELARAIATGLGVTIAGLREMGAAGELTAVKVIGALEKQSESVNKEYQQTAKTVTQAMTQIENVALKTFGSLDSSELIDSMDELRKIISDPAIVSGLQSIGSVMLNIVNLGVQAAAGWGMIFDKILGQDNADKIKNINRQIEDQLALIGRLNNQSRAANWIDNQFGMTQQEKIDQAIAKVKQLAVEKEKLNAPTDGGGATGSSESGSGSVVEPLEMPSPEEDPAYIQALLVNGLLIQADQERTRAAEEEAKIRAANEMAANQMQLSSAQTMYSALSGLIAATGNESKGIQLAMIAFEKGLAIAQSIINTQVGVTKALSVDPTGILAGRVQLMGNIATGLIAATGVIQAGRVAGQAHDGMDEIPNTGSYILQKGEMVIDKGTSDQVRNNVTNNNGGGTTNITIQAWDGVDVERVLMNNKELIHGANASQMNEFGQSYG